MFQLAVRLPSDSFGDGGRGWGQWPTGHRKRHYTLWLIPVRGSTRRRFGCSEG